MAVKRDYYEVLGVSRQAAPEELKRAFRKIAMDSHPDRNPDDPAAAARFKEASEAYTILSDPGRRRTYDMYGHAAVESGAGPAVDFSDMPTLPQVGSRKADSSPTYATLVPLPRQ